MAEHDRMQERLRALVRGARQVVRGKDVFDTVMLNFELWCDERALRGLARRGAMAHARIVLTRTGLLSCDEFP